MNKLTLWVLFMTTVVLGAGSYYYYMWTMYFSDDAKVINQVKGTLNDPDSAKFKDVKYFSNTKAGCGSVNAKNKMGGFVGYTRFIALPEGEVIFDPKFSDLKTFSNLLDVYCPDKAAEQATN